MNKIEFNKVVVVSAVETLPLLIQKVYKVKNKIRKVNNDKFLPYNEFIKDVSTKTINSGINVSSIDPCCILYSNANNCLFF